MNSALFGDIEDEDMEDAFDELDKDIAKEKNEDLNLPNAPVNLVTKSLIESKKDGVTEKKERVAEIEE